MSTPIVHAGVLGYVAAVRACLDDLTDDEVDELTDGLEADLDDALGDPAAAGRTPEEQFGPTEVYAAELRAAAGLPPRAEEGGRHGAAGLAARARGVAARVRAHPQWPAVRDFVGVLRPAWWVLRAALAVLVIGYVFGNPGFFLMLLLFGPALVVSVQLGRRNVAGRSLGWRLAIGFGNTIAVLALFVVGPLGLPVRTEVVTDTPVPFDGVWVDGAEVRNIFPYDEQGRPLSGVQLYDETGRPVRVGESARSPLTDEQGRSAAQVPAVDAAGQQRWNVFPLRQQTSSVDPSTGTERPDAGGPQPAVPPRITPGPLIAGGSSGSSGPAVPSASSSPGGVPSGPSR